MRRLRKKRRFDPYRWSQNTFLFHSAHPGDGDGLLIRTRQVRVLRMEPNYVPVSQMNNGGASNTCNEGLNPSRDANLLAVVDNQSAQMAQ